MSRIVQFKRRRRPYPIILYTSDACVIRGTKQSGIPILIDEWNQVVWPVVQYFTYLRVVEARSPSSLKTYADHLRMFWEFLASEKIDWKDVDDDLLTTFRNRQKSGKKVSHGQSGLEQKETTINGRLQTIFSFYWWSCLNGFVNPDVIGPAEWNRDGRHFRPQIVVEMQGKDLKSDLSHKNLNYTSHLFYKNPPAPKRNVPTDEHVTKMHANLSCFRDHLVVQWTELTSLRVHEIGKLTLKHIPSYDEIDSLRVKGEYHKFLIKGKGNKSRYVFVLPDLLEDTMDYIEQERADIVKCKKKCNRDYKEPEFIFLSSTTGLPLKSNTISKYTKKAFKDAGLDNRHHDLRAKYVTDVIRVEIDNAAMGSGGIAAVEAGAILLKAAERMGHNSIEHLRPYLDLEMKRIYSEKSGSVASRVDEAIRAKERRLGVLVERMASVSELKEVAISLASGDISKAIEQLERLIGELKKSNILILK